MGGASTAAPLDAIGALYWNPATISALPSEIGFGVGLMLADLETSSSITGLGGGTTSAEPGVVALPSIGFVYREKDSPLTFGLGVHAVAGFKTNYPSSTTNPIFLPQSNAVGVPGGFGRVFTQAAFLQLAPTISYALTEKLSVGFGPTITLGELIIDPLVTSGPDDADGSGAARYPSGRGTRIHWGGGAQLGVYYIRDDFWHFGMSIKTPQWMEDIRHHSEDELGRPRVGKTPFELPMIISIGAAYSGYEHLVLAVDVRYFDYKNADFFGGHGFRPDGSLNGLGMSSILAVAVGGQYSVSDALDVRMGYTFNQNPQRKAEVTSAVGAALFYQHSINAGATRRLSEVVDLNIAYSYYPEATLSGPLTTPGGVVPGSSVTTRESVHLANFGVSVKF